MKRRILFTAAAGLFANASFGLVFGGWGIPENMLGSRSILHLQWNPSPEELEFLATHRTGASGSKQLSLSETRGLETAQEVLVSSGTEVLLGGFLGGMGTGSDITPLASLARRFYLSGARLRIVGISPFGFESNNVWRSACTDMVMLRSYSDDAELLDLTHWLESGHQTERLTVRQAVTQARREALEMLLTG